MTTGGSGARYLQRLSKRLFTLVEGQRCWFWFTPDRPPYLAIEPLSGDGKRHFEQILSRVGDPADTLDQRGLLVTGSDGRLRLLWPGDPRELLEALSRFVEARKGRAPSLTVFGGATAARAELPLDDEAALADLDLGAFEFTAVPELWAPVCRPSPEEIEHVLVSRPLGAMTWFAVRDSDEHAVLLVPAEEDPRQQRLQRMLEALPYTRTWSGVAMPTTNGRWQLTTSQADPEAIERVAAWVKRHVGDFPGLARLRDLELVKPNPFGAAGEILGVPEVWEGVPKPGHELDLDPAEVLASLAVGSRAWAFGTLGLLWLADVGAVTDDAQSLQGALAARFGRGSLAVLSHPTEATRVLTCPPGEVGRWASILASVSSQPGLEELESAVVVGSANGSPVAFEPVDRVVAARAQARALSELQAEDALLFWVLPADRSGRPVVVIGADKANVVSRAKRWSAGRQEAGVRGRVTRGEDGVLEFSAKTDVDDLLTPLAAWADAFRWTVPEVSALAHARYIRLGDDGAPLEVREDPALWS